MPTLTTSLRVLAVAALMAATQPANAQDGTTEQTVSEVDPNQVLATVNGTEITLAHVIAVRAKLPPEYAQLPPELLFDGIVEQLVQQTLLSQSFEGELSLQSRVMLENENRAIKAAEAIALLITGQFDQDELLAAYNEQYPEENDKLEYKASHILVETEEEATALLEKLDEGADFAELAKENSIGPSSTVGGDVGWFAEGDMVPAFYEAASTIEVGEIAGPVETQFGWHVLTLTDTRQAERPEFDTVRAELEGQMRQTVLEERIQELTETAEIDQVDVSKLDASIINRVDLLEN